jgi:hypothetical protein
MTLGKTGARLPEHMSAEEDARTEHRPLRDAGVEELTGTLEDRKQDARAAVDEVTAALLNEDEPLTDEKVEQVASAAGSLMAASRSLIHRVPEEHRTNGEWSR